MRGVSEKLQQKCREAAQKQRERVLSFIDSTGLQFSFDTTGRNHDEIKRALELHFAKDLVFGIPDDEYEFDYVVMCVSQLAYDLMTRMKGS